MNFPTILWKGKCLNVVLNGLICLRASLVCPSGPLDPLKSPFYLSKDGARKCQGLSEFRILSLTSFIQTCMVFNIFNTSKTSNDDDEDNDANDACLRSLRILSLPSFTQTCTVLNIFNISKTSNNDDDEDDDDYDDNDAIDSCWRSQPDLWS